jgi:hypothetical protein
MDKPFIIIDACDADIGSLWVHMQSVEGKRYWPYRMVVPIGRAAEVFDPQSTRASGVGWAEHVQSLVDELGTCMLEAYVKNMVKCAQAGSGHTEWVVATLDEVRESEDFIELLGKVVGYDPARHRVQGLASVAQGPKGHA